jgi:hypothetical protein
VTAVPLHERQEYIFFASKVGVERTLGVPGGSGDVVDLRSVESVLDE